MKVLITAFEPYDQWESNSSWDSLTELLKTRGVPNGVTTRRYPVHLERLRDRLYGDLERGFDAVLHLGQRPGIGWISIESIAINVAGVTHSPSGHFGPLITDGAVAFQTSFPIRQWHQALDEAGIPSALSYHAGTYLCNAIMYLTQHWHAERKLKCDVGFLHFPLTQQQVIAAGREMPSLPVTELARAIHVVLEQIQVGRHEATQSQLA